MDFAKAYDDAFQRATGEHLGPQHTVDISRIEAAENRLGLRFPKSLREFYKVAGNIEVPEDYGDWLYSPEDLIITSGYFHFLNDYIAEPFYGVCLDDIDLENPFVYLLLPDLVAWCELAVLSQSTQSEGRVCEFLCDRIEKWASYKPLWS